MAVLEKRTLFDPKLVTDLEQSKGRKFTSNLVQTNTNPIQWTKRICFYDG